MKQLLAVLSLFLFQAHRGAADHAIAADAPRVCLASLEKKADGKHVRLRFFRGTAAHPVTATVVEKSGRGGDVTSTVSIVHQRFVEDTVTLPAESVSAFDSSGKELTPAQLGARLAKESPVLALFGKPEPAVLKAVKKGTLILVLPVPLDAEHEHGHAAPPSPPPAAPKTPEKIPVEPTEKVN